MVTGVRASLWVLAMVTASLAGCSRGGGAADPEDFALPAEETSTDTSNVAAAGSGEPTNAGGGAPVGGDTSGGSMGSSTNAAGGMGSLPSDDAGMLDANTSASMAFGGGGIPGFGSGGAGGGIPGFGTGGFNIPGLPGQDGGFSLGDGGFPFP